MARYRCRDCGKEGEFIYEGIRACPVCGSKDVQFALSIDELTDDDPLIVALKKQAEEGTEE